MSTLRDIVLMLCLFGCTTAQTQWRRTFLDDDSIQTVISNPNFGFLRPSRVFRVNANGGGQLLFTRRGVGQQGTFRRGVGGNFNLGGAVSLRGLGTPLNLGADVDLSAALNLQGLGGLGGLGLNAFGGGTLYLTDLLRRR